MSSVPCSSWIRSEDSFGISDSRHSTRKRITLGNVLLCVWLAERWAEEFTWTQDDGLDGAEHGGIRAPQREGTQWSASHAHGAHGVANDQRRSVYRRHRV